jgi:hypothetical protein
MGRHDLDASFDRRQWQYDNEMPEDRYPNRHAREEEDPDRARDLAMDEEE